MPSELSRPGQAEVVNQEVIRFEEYVCFDVGSLRYVAWLDEEVTCSCLYSTEQTKAGGETSLACWRSSSTDGCAGT